MSQATVFQILKENPGKWMSTKEIHSKVNNECSKNNINKNCTRLAAFNEIESRQSYSKVRGKFFWEYRYSER